MKIRIADDHQLYRDALSMLVQRLEPQVEIETASSYAELLSLAAQGGECDAMLVDLNMPGMSYYDGIGQLSRDYPNTPIIVITSSDKPDDVAQALDAGALGLILKSTDSEDMLASLRLMLNSGVSIHPSTISVEKKEKELALAQSSTLDTLTPRQREVLHKLCQGDSNKRIALDMDLSESTVKLHVRAILRALNVENRTQAVLVARDLIQSS